MKVLKFGGTSLGSIESLRNVQKIIESQPGRQIIVVSALGGVTDRLIAMAHQASRADNAYLESLRELTVRHHEIIETLVPEARKQDVFNTVYRLLEELGNIYRGVSLIRDLGSRTLNMIVSYGERLSSCIMAGIIADSTLMNSLEFIKTRKQPGSGVLDDALTEKMIHSRFDSLDFKRAIVQGFISTDTDGVVTNLGRGGSDYTAAIMAAALDAEEFQMWTDVDGFMTADPRVIDNALVIPHLTFREAMELCNFGAKVVYPPTIYPVYHKNIPVIIRNTFNPEAPGTIISKHASDGDGDKLIKGISSINDTALVSISGLGMVGVIGVNSRIFNCLARNSISVFMVSQASSENNTSIAVRNQDAARAIMVLEEEFATELMQGSISSITAEHNLATVAIVGESMKHTPGIAGKLFHTLGRNGISVICVAQGASQTNISFVIRLEHLQKALGVIHDSFFLSSTQTLNLFIVGVGNVGGHLIEQIRAQQGRLLKDKSLEIKVAGISNSRKCIFNAEGIDLADYKQLLETSQDTASAALIARRVIEMNLFNSVFVDCTASAQIAELYARMLQHNINVVTANKIAASSGYANYKELKDIARRRDVKFLFETNVGAGLPIINTINSLINSGDKIQRIEAVLSGTLNYIFNTLSEDTGLSKAVELARDAGYSEPDPRLDLSGQDVVRKLVILAREAGYTLEQKDIEKRLFIPDDMFSGDAEEFMKRLPQLDADMEKLRSRCAAEGKRLRFVAVFEADHAYIGLEEIEREHPFYNLEGSNNAILLTTERYHDYPMAIRGYGAGAEVTAAGIFADIISIANIR